MSDNQDERTSFDGVEQRSVFSGIPHPSSQEFHELDVFCRGNAEEVDASLPWLAAAVRRNDGSVTMLNFVKRWSGMRIYVPKAHSRFANSVGVAIGTETHASILSVLGTGAQIEVPSAWGVFLALRRTAIEVATRSEMPHREIARRFGVTMRSLR